MHANPYIPYNDETLLTIPPISALPLSAHHPGLISHLITTSRLGWQSASKTIAPCKRSQERFSCNLSDTSLHPTPPRCVIISPTTTASTQHTERARRSSDHGKHADSRTSKNMKATGWVNKPHQCLSGVWLKRLLSGGTLSLCGQPDRLRWWGYRPVTWPVPSQPGVGHRLSFLSAREASASRKSYCGNRTQQYNMLARERQALRAAVRATRCNETSLPSKLQGSYNAIGEPQKVRHEEESFGPLHQQGRDGEEHKMCSSAIKFSVC